MDNVITATHITVADQLAEASFTVRQGSVTAILTAKDEINLTLARLIIGYLPPTSGELSIFDRPIPSLSRKELLQLRQDMGIVYASGGLVSNLKVWENLTFPLLYHTSRPRDEIEKRGIRMLERLGYSGGLMELPGPLSIYQKRVLGTARAMMSDPKLMIYESPSQGLNHHERNFLLDAALRFHQELPERTSVFITSNPAVLKRLANAEVINLTKGSAE